MSFTKKMKTWLRRSSLAKQRKRRRALQRFGERHSAVFETLESRQLLAADLFAPDWQPASMPAYYVRRTWEQAPTWYFSGVADDALQTEVSLDAVGVFSTKTDATFANSTVTRPHTLVFVDPAVEDYQSLVDGLVNSELGASGLQLVLLDVERDGVAQITDVLGGYQDLSAVHFLTHGFSGGLQLGSARLDAVSLGQYSQQIQSWGKSFAPGGDLLLYGCDVAEGQAGVQFVNRLADLTGADVAASVDATGSSDLGGDWELERGTGVIESALLSPQAGSLSWNGILAGGAPTEAADQITFTGSGGSDVLDLRVTDGGKLEYKWDGSRGLHHSDNLRACRWPDHRVSGRWRRFLFLC